MNFVAFRMVLIAIVEQRVRHRGTFGKHLNRLHIPLKAQLRRDRVAAIAGFSVPSATATTNRCERVDR